MSEKLPLATPTPAARRRVDRREIVVDQTARADHHRDAALQRERDVPAHDRRVGVVDEHVGRAVERGLEVALERDAERRSAERLADVAAGLAPRDRRMQREITRRGNRGHEHAPDAAECAGDADAEGPGRGTCLAEEQRQVGPVRLEHLVEQLLRLAEVEAGLRRRIEQERVQSPCDRPRARP